jgi:hypothetical protein
MGTANVRRWRALARGFASVALLTTAACGSSTAGAGPDGGSDSSPREDAGSNDSSGDGGGEPIPDPAPGADRSAWPEGNTYSWDGSWTPDASDFPLEGLLDDEYHDGHDGTPILPPGEWDWKDENDDTANWRNFHDNLGDFEKLTDSADHHYGWRFVGNEQNVDYAGPATYFEGSSGTDLMNLGPAGSIHSFGEGNLAGGPDVLVFNTSYSLDFRTGSSETGSARDNDLVVAGCDSNPDGSYDIETTTVHTGPGHDWVFARDVSRAAIDLGNGAGGRTDTLDPADGDDLLVLRGNAHDFRVFGGTGDDIAVWYVDETVQTTEWLGPNFFGGGGIEDALWNDEGTDRLVLAIPTDTELVTEPSTPEGGLLVMASDGSFREDEPTAEDPFARYCIECGEGPGGARTMILEYNSADGSVATGFFYVTDFEELQIGFGSDARLYRLDDVGGTAAPADELEPFAPPAVPDRYCE